MHKSIDDRRFGELLVESDDLQVVALAAALENLAVTAYDGAPQAASAGTPGTVPPAIATFVQAAMKQHADHANACNSVLTKAGKPALLAVK